MPRKKANAKQVVQEISPTGNSIPPLSGIVLAGVIWLSASQFLLQGLR